MGRLSSSVNNSPVGSGTSVTSKAKSISELCRKVPNALDPYTFTLFNSSYKSRLIVDGDIDWRTEFGLNFLVLLSVYGSI